MPLAAMILTLARFIGSEFIDLPPVLDSYWRPIHVGTASLSYGIALVCFAIAVLYLLKDNTKVEAMAIWSSIFAIGVIASVSKFSVFTDLVYRAGLFVPNAAGGKPFFSPFRLAIPYVGVSLVISALLLAGVIGAFLLYIYKNSEPAKKAGHFLLKLSLVAQLVAMAFLVSGIKTTTDVSAKLQAQLAADPTQYAVAGKAMAERQELSASEFAALSPIQLEQMGRSYIQANGNSMFLSLNTNPVEVAGLLTGAGRHFLCNSVLDQNRKAPRASAEPSVVGQPDV